MTTYPKVKCPHCGREIGSNNFKRHIRRCEAALKYFKEQGHAVHLFDERKVKTPL
jgi:DNA-directed RNA polymerase subunit N (RpoN/RPB10)